MCIFLRFHEDTNSAKIRSMRTFPQFTVKCDYFHVKVYVFLTELSTRSHISAFVDPDIFSASLSCDVDLETDFLNLILDVCVTFVDVSSTVGSTILIRRCSASSTQQPMKSSVTLTIRILLKRNTRLESYLKWFVGFWSIVLFPTLEYYVRHIKLRSHVRWCTHCVQILHICKIVVSKSKIYIEISPKGLRDTWTRSSQIYFNTRVKILHIICMICTPWVDQRMWVGF